MEQKSIVSIIVPVYNSDSYLRKCVDSIIGQTYKDVEIILVDDGSTDTSGQLCDLYLRENNNVKVIHKVNEGPGQARESGIKLATGDFIAFADSDDYLEKEMIQTMLDNFHENIDIVECGYYLVSDDNKIIETVKMKPQIVIGSKECLIHFTIKKNSFDYIWNKMFRKALFYDVVFPKVCFGEDYSVLTQLFAYSRGVKNIAKPLYNYVMTPDSQCRKPFTEKRIDGIYAGEFVFNFYSKHFPDLIAFPAFYVCFNVAMLSYQLQYSVVKNKSNYQKQLLFYFDKYYKYTNNFFLKSNIGWKRLLIIYIFNISPIVSNYIFYYRLNPKK